MANRGLSWRGFTWLTRSLCLLSATWLHQSPIHSRRKRFCHLMRRVWQVTHDRREAWGNRARGRGGSRNIKA